MSPSFSSSTPLRRLLPVAFLGALLGISLGNGLFAEEEHHPFGLQIGESLPTEALEHELLGLDDSRSRLGELWGAKGALLVFTSNTCPYSTDWQDRLPPLAAEAARGEVGFVVINANARKRKNDDSPEAMAALAEEQDWSFPYWIDEASGLADRLGAQRTPEVFLFDGQKKLVYRGAPDDHSGPLEAVTQHWAGDALGNLIAGTEVAVSSSPAVGCKILRPRKPRD